MWLLCMTRRIKKSPGLSADEGDATMNDASVRYYDSGKVHDTSVECWGPSVKL